MKQSGLFANTRYDLVILAASAGGLPTLIRLLGSIPRDFPAAAIFVQHLAPKHPSMLAEILSRRTPLLVKEAHDQDLLTPGVLYITPPDQHTTVTSEGILRLSDSAPVRFLRPSIDYLLESAAVALPGRLMAVILSGMGDDGSLGVQAVKRAGGMVIVEDPRLALFPGMPQSAIQTGSVDLVLPADEIGGRIIGLVVTEGEE